jgi:hypothetical protein
LKNLPGDCNTNTILYYMLNVIIESKHKIKLAPRTQLSVGSFEVEQCRKVGYQLLQCSQSKSRNQHINSLSSCRSQFGIRIHLDNKQFANQLRMKNATAQTRQKTQQKIIQFKRITIQTKTYSLNSHHWPVQDQSPVSMHPTSYPSEALTL